MDAQLTLDDIPAVACGARDEDIPRARHTDPVLALKAFLANNPEAYGYVIRWIQRDIAEGRMCSMHGYLWLLRRYNWVAEGGEPYKVSNNWSRPFVDLIIGDHPEYGQHFERRGRRDADADGGGAPA